jgi:hypothetical protein
MAMDTGRFTGDDKFLHPLASAELYDPGSGE